MCMKKSDLGLGQDPKASVEMMKGEGSIVLSPVCFAPHRRGRRFGGTSVPTSALWRSHFYVAHPFSGPKGASSDP